MLSFKAWLVESEVNTHLSHLSEMMFIEGIAGAKKVVDLSSRIATLTQTF